MDFQNYFDHSFLFPFPWMEQPQYHWDWDSTISDPPTGAPATPSYTHPPQAAGLPPELPQTSQASQIPRGQEMVGLPGL